MGFRWHLHSQFDEDDPSWILGPRTSARQMLDTEVSVELRPAPFEEPPPVRAPSASATVVMPAAVIARWTSEEFHRWAPAGSEAERTLLFRLGPAETLGVWSPVRKHRPDEVDPERIRARWTRGDLQRDIEADGPWPLELLLSLVERLVAPQAASRSNGMDFGALDTTRQVWNLARVALETAVSMQGWLDTPRPASFGFPLDLLRSR